MISDGERVRGAARSLGFRSRLTATLCVLVAACILPAPAWAGWSDVSRVPLSAGGLWSTAAVAARGDVAVAWIQEGRSGGHATVRVRAAVRAVGATRFSVRTLVARRDLAARGTAVAFDRRGELTVAWIEQASDNSSLHGHKVVRAAYRTPAGRWSGAQSVGRSSAFNYATPLLAATPDGTVVLTYNSRSGSSAGVAVAAWRSRGRAFGAVQSVPTGHQQLLDPTLGIDPDGRVWLTRTTGCTGPGGDVTVAARSTGRRRFTARTVVRRAPGKAVRMAVMEPDAVALAWLGGNVRHVRNGRRAGVRAALRRGSASEPVALGTAAALTVLVAPAPVGADVSFATSPTAGSAVLMHAQIAADGAVAAPIVHRTGGSRWPVTRAAID